MAAIKVLLDQGKVEEAIPKLLAETEESPAHDTARIWLAEAYERAGQPDKALDAWSGLLAATSHEENARQARRALNRLRRDRLDRAETETASATGEREDPFKIAMPPVDWATLEAVEDSKYLPPIPGHPFEVPPFVHKTKHFTVYAANEKLAKVVAERAEIYLEFMIEQLFGGRLWASRIPIIVYTTAADYQQHGGPPDTGGVTMGHITGKTERILLYQLESSSGSGARASRGRGGGSGQKIWTYGLESVLPHELTHAVINEFFAGRPTPTWLHEAVAGRFEQTRDHYGEAARLARKVVAGEYFRMRDLFEQKGYPKLKGLFYEQAAAVVLYLFESGRDAMHAFLEELAEKENHDAACAAALGIPQDNAVEEFERRWVNWMKARYAKDLAPSGDASPVAQAEKSRNAVFLPWVNELDTVDKLESFKPIALDALDAFRGVGDTKADWSVAEGKLRCQLPPERGSSLLAIPLAKRAPVVVRCRVRCSANPAEKNRWFGFTQLDADMNDTRAEVVAPLRDNEPHQVVCIWSDDLALYLNGVCVGRYPADHVSGDAPDIDFPLALVTYVPVEVEDLQVAPIEKFSDAAVVAEAEKPAPSSPGRKRTERSSTERRGRRDRKPP